MSPPPGGPAVRVAVAPVVLWCATDSGPACEAASRTLGVSPVPAALVPATLLEDFQDLPDDCREPEVERLVSRLAPALGLPVLGWSDQGGRSVSVDHIGRIYMGGGCISPVQSGAPTVKVHVQPSGSRPTFLVRVWESGAR